MNLTREEIENMPAGKEINALVAEEIMGWHSNGFDWLDADNRYQHRLSSGYEDAEDFHLINWNPSESILWAWEVKNYMVAEKGYHFSMQTNENCGNVVGSCAFTEVTELYVAGNTYKVFIENDEPLAICRAALLAVMEAK